MSALVWTVLAFTCLYECGTHVRTHTCTRLNANTSLRLASAQPFYIVPLVPFYHSLPILSSHSVAILICLQLALIDYKGFRVIAGSLRLVFCFFFFFFFFTFSCFLLFLYFLFFGAPMAALLCLPSGVNGTCIGLRSLRPTSLSFSAPYWGLRHVNLRFL